MMQYLDGNLDVLSKTMDEPLDDRCKTWTVKHGRPFFILDVYCKLWTLVQKYGRHYKKKCGEIFIEFEKGGRTKHFCFIERIGTNKF